MEEIEVVINITKHEWEYLNKLVDNGDQLGHMNVCLLMEHHFHKSLFLTR